MLTFYFFTLSCQREVDKSKKSHKYYSSNIREVLEIDPIPYISKNILEQYILGLFRHAQK